MKFARKNHVLTCIAPLFAALLGAEASASAQNDPSIAVAEALFQEARALVEQEKWSEACPKFAESQRLDPKLGTLLNLAHCHEQEGKSATAWAEYTSAASLARRMGQKEREEFARERVEALQQKLAQLVIRMETPPPGLTLHLDKQAIDATALGTPLPIDPGKHLLTATVPGKKAFSVEVDGPPRKVEILVTIPPFESDPAKPASPPVPQQQPNAQAIPSSRTPPFSAEAEDPRKSHARILMITGFGVSAVGALVGTVTGIATLAKASQIHPDCNGSRCASDQADNIATANALANASNIGFGVSAIFLAGGIAGVLIMPKGGNTRSALALTPFVGPGALGLRGSF